MLHETFWFRAHGIEGYSNVEENHDPRHHHDQSRLMPARYRGDLESAALMLGVGLAAGAFKPFLPALEILSFRKLYYCVSQPGHRPAQLRQNNN